MRSIALAALCFSLLAGCAAIRDYYNVPAPDLPKQYAKAPVAADIANPKNTSTRPPVPPSPLGAALAEWWRLLGSHELNGLMDRALANNPDLRIAALRIAQSKARLDQAGADKAPVITMPAQVKNEYPESGIGRGKADGNNKSRTTHQISLKGDWRPDIWGETHSLYDSAELQLLRTTYQRDDMQRKVVAGVAVNYMEYLSLNDRLRVVRETEKSLGEMLASVNARLEIGDTTITEMEQQEAAVHSVKATIPVLDQQREVVLNRLASLAGSAPVELKLSDGGLDSAKFPPVLPGVPSALLLRRPDVRAAEARLLAADADIDVARARVLPPLDLTAQIGYGSVYMSKLFMPQSLFWSAIANLSATIFDSGKRSMEVEFAQAVHEEMVETYVRVIYDAVREVDDSLSAISLMGKRLEMQGVATDSSLRAWNFSQEAFMAGAVDYLVVLDTQRTYQRNLDDWYNVRMERYRGLVNLFSALGGGVPEGDAMPGEGVRPAPSAGEPGYGAVFAETGAMPKAENDAAQRAGGVAAKADRVAGAQPRKEAERIAEMVDWAGNSLRGGANHWLAELSGVYDRGAVLPAWRDLRARFPRQVESRILLPQRQGQVDAAGKERASWYRLFVGTFPGKKMAEEFCATLRAEQQRCGVVPSQSLAGKGDFVAPSDQPGSVIARVGAASEAANQDMAQVKGVQKTRGQAEQPVTAQTSPQAVSQAGQATEAGAPVEKQAAPETVQPAKTMQPAETVAAQLLDSSPETLVEHWMKDWAEKNVDGYLSHYDIGFQPGDGKDRGAWEANRRRRITEATTIKVRAENLKIERHNELMATARFVETIEVGSYKKTSRKQLLLARRNRDGEWKIWEEKEETKAEAARAKAVQDAKAALAATPSGKEQFDGVDWSDQQFWLVEMSDVHDRNTVTAARLDLLTRYPAQMKNREILLRRQGGMSNAGEERASRYQLFIARFPEKQMAEEFCATLRAGQQRCGVVSSQSLAGKDGLNFD
ncbi:MAG: efflux transporter outer membrane subunit [Nitrosomonadales bacterium]|nr:efflux transporter outer membrane subunit [Nitrosomonadales bacterium]